MWREVVYVDRDLVRRLMMRLREVAVLGAAHRRAVFDGGGLGRGHWGVQLGHCACVGCRCQVCCHLLEYFHEAEALTRRVRIFIVRYY